MSNENSDSKKHRKPTELTPEDKDSVTRHALYLLRQSPDLSRQDLRAKIFHSANLQGNYWRYGRENDPSSLGWYDRNEMLTFNIDQILDEVMSHQAQFKAEAKAESDALPTKPFQLFIKTLTGKTIIIDPCTFSDTIASIKERVFKQEGIPVAAQRIIINGTERDNNLSLLDFNYHLRPEVAHLVTKLNFHPSVAEPPSASPPSAASSSSSAASPSPSAPKGSSFSSAASSSSLPITSPSSAPSPSSSTRRDVKAVLKEVTQDDVFAAFEQAMKDDNTKEEKSKPKEKTAPTGGFARLMHALSPQQAPTFNRRIKEVLAEYLEDMSKKRKNFSPNAMALISIAQTVIKGEAKNQKQATELRSSLHKELTDMVESWKPPQAPPPPLTHE